MKLENIVKNTYYINASTNCGVFIFPDNTCLLIDTGFNTNSAKKIIEVVTKAGIQPGYIFNTHSHPDHCGGNSYICEQYKKVKVYASEGEKLFMENPQLSTMVIYSSYAPDNFNSPTIPLRVDVSAQSGYLAINDYIFNVIETPGHSPAQVAIVTSDMVCFVGDAVISDEIIIKYGLPYTLNIGESLNTLAHLKNISAEFFVIAHANDYYQREEFLKLADRNIDNINKFKEKILILTKMPIARESILETIIVENNLEFNPRQYYFYLAVVSAYLTWLCNLGYLDFVAENGRIVYFNKE